MDRDDLTLAVAGALVAAVLLGWLIGAATRRLSVRGPGDAARARDLAERLEVAETARRQAEARQSDLAARLADAEAELAATLKRLERERQQTEEIRAAYRLAMAEREG